MSGFDSNLLIWWLPLSFYYSKNLLYILVLPFSLWAVPQSCLRGCLPWLKSSKSLLNQTPESGSFPMSQFVTSEWPKYWSFSFSISPSNEHPGLISFRMDWLDLLVVQGLSRVFSNTTVQKHPFFMFNLLYGPTLTSVHHHWKNRVFSFFSSYAACGILASRPEIDPMPQQ